MSGAAGIPTVHGGEEVNERRLDLAGVSTAVLEGGHGPPVVLLHGQGGWSGMWLPVAADLVRTHRVIAPDLPGLGASTVPDGPPDAARVLAWLGALTERTCPEPPAMVGASLGASRASSGRWRWTRPGPRPCWAPTPRRTAWSWPARPASGPPTTGCCGGSALVWGRRDRVMRLGITERASAHYGWPLEVIEDAGHLSLEQPEALRAALGRP